MHAYPPSNFRFAESFFEESRGLQAAMLQFHTIKSNSGWMSHAEQYTRIERICH